MAADYTINATIAASPAGVTVPPQLVSIASLEVRAVVFEFQSSEAPVLHPGFMGGGGGGVCPPADVRPVSGFLYPRRAG